MQRKKAAPSRFPCRSANKTKKSQNKWDRVTKALVK